MDIPDPFMEDVRLWCARVLWLALGFVVGWLL